MKDESCMSMASKLLLNFQTAIFIKCISNAIDMWNCQNVLKCNLFRHAIFLIMLSFGGL